jgi:putative hydrolase of the HAD superfamily
MAIKVVSFDAADTLFRVRGSVGEVYARTAARHGVVVEAASIEARFRAAFRAMPPLAFPGVAAADLARCEYDWWRTLVAEVFSDRRFVDFAAFFEDLFRCFARPDSWELFPDTQPCLEELRACGLRLGIVSNFDARLFALCDGLGIGAAFDAIVISARAGYAKPDPRIFAAALAALRVAAAEALHVGDSVRDDVAGARAAGLRAVLLRRAGRHGAAPEEIAGLREVLPLLA